MLTPVELRGPWNYVALGHYHVQCEVGEHQWYAGALDYCSPNPWGELHVEAKANRGGKGWLMFDFDTGRATRHAIEAPRRFLEAFGGRAVPASVIGSGRLELSRRMVAPAITPFVPRVLVNRLWLHHFGEGIVRTPDDFGVMGQRPTHPELLDWLAAKFTESEGDRRSSARAGGGKDNSTPQLSHKSYWSLGALQEHITKIEDRVVERDQYESNDRPND